MGQTTNSTETTTVGLAALVRYIAGASRRGELDPEFVRKLCKRIGKEYEVLLETGRMRSEDEAELLVALEALQGAAVDGESKLLAKALRRLRAADKDSGAGSTA